jgi:hypothetical protein
MRLMSFALTTEQFQARTKTVTRRLGWDNLKVGELLCGVKKGQGIRKGGHVERLHVIQCVGHWRERLRRVRIPSYGRDQLIAEGFPNLDAAAFIKMFCKHNHCTPDTWINVIQFRHFSDRDSRYYLVFHAVQRLFPYSCSEWDVIADRICAKPSTICCNCCGLPCGDNRCTSPRCKEAIAVRNQIKV